MATKEELIETILYYQFGGPKNWVPPSQPPLLDERYLERVSHAVEAFSEIISDQRAVLKQLSVRQLAEVYAPNGSANLQEDRENWDIVRRRAFGVFKDDPLIQAGMGDPKCMADYDYWSRMDWLSIREAVWLSIGLEPRFDWESALIISKSYGREKSPYLKHAEELMEQIRRFTKRAYLGEERLHPGKLLDWIREANFPSHSGFLEVLDNAARRVASGGKLDAPIDQPMDKREIATVAKIITALAVDGYGYRPQSKRSPIPGELEGICDRLGLPVTRETILKYLRIGSKYLTEEDKRQ